MKFLNLKLLALIAFLSIGSNICAYTWSFSNHTDKTITIRFGLMGAAGWWHGTVEPSDKLEFAMGGWWAGYCAWGFEWIDEAANAPHITPEMIQNYNKVGTNPAFLVATGKLKKPIPLSHINQWKPGNAVYLPVEVYNETVKNAAKIGTGFDTFLCNAFWAVKVIATAAKSQCPSVFGALIEWMGGVIARSACANREYEILQDDRGNIEFFTYLH